MKTMEAVEKFGLNGKSWVVPAEFEYMAPYIDAQPEEGRLLEIGTGLGHSSGVFALIKPKWTIYTVDTYNFYGEQIEGSLRGVFGIQELMLSRVAWEQRGIKNIVPILCDSKTVPWELPIDILFIDGDHTYEGIKNDIERFGPFVKKTGVILCHDAWKIKPYIDTIRDGWKINDDRLITVLQWLD